MPERQATTARTRSQSDTLSSPVPRRPPPAGDSSSVHTHEISGPTQPDPDYREYRLRRLDPAFVRSSQETFKSAFSWDRRRTERYDNCRKRAFFYQNNADHTVKVGSNSCKNRWCPICSTTRSLHVANACQEWLKSCHNPKFITFTMKHSLDELRPQINRLKSYFRRLRKTLFWTSRVQGGVWFYQVTINHDDLTWHVHLHVIADALYMPQKVLSDLWRHITKDSYIVDIRTLTDHKVATNYASRYSARAANVTYFPDDKKIEFALSTDHLHTFGSFGTAYKSTLFKVKKLDKTAWTPIGAWSDVVSQLDSNPIAAAVFEAWRSGSPLFTQAQVLPKSEHDFVTERDPPCLNLAPRTSKMRITPSASG